MNNQMILKKRKLAKYPMGGETKTPEEIQYEEYLARNNKTVNGQKALLNQQDSSITGNQNQIANVDTGNQIATGIIGNTSWGGIAMGARNFGEGLVKKKMVTDPNGYQHEEPANDMARHELAALKPYHEYVMDDIATAGKSGKAKDYGNAALSVLGLNTVKDTFGFGRKSTVKEDANKEIYATQKAQQDELDKQNQFGIDKANLASYNMKGTEGVNYYNAKGGKIKYANYDGTNKGYVMAEGGEILPTNPTTPVNNNPTPKPYNPNEFNSLLSKYPTIDYKKPPQDVVNYMSTSITPTLKNYQSQLNIALRGKYKLKDTDPITNQFLTPEEADKAIGGKYKDYMDVYHGYQNYRQKASGLAPRGTEGTDDFKGDDVYGQRHVNLLQPYKVPQKSEGGTIHINPENKGKFNETKARTGETTEELTHSSNPLTRKRAIFAQNASKWNHALGGEMIPLASDTHLASGDKHSEDTNKDGLGGITLTNNNGKPYAEIEDKEVTKGNKVYSDRIMLNATKTIADEATKLGKEKGKFEVFLNSGDSAKKGTAERNIQKTDLKLKHLFEFQESKKDPNENQEAEKNNPKEFMAYGGDGLEPLNAEDPSIKFIDKSNINGMNTMYADDPKLANLKTPVTYDATGKPRAKLDYGSLVDNTYNAGRFVDNIVNARLTNKTEQVPRPHLQQSAVLDTNYNINPALNEQRTDLSNFDKNVDANNSNSNTGNAEKQNALAEKFKASNQLYGDKFNKEVQLKNENALNNQSIAGRNLAKLDEYDMNKYNRSLMLKGEKSANIANAVEDFGNIGTERSQKRLDDQTINNTLKLYSENDAAAYKGYDTFYDSAKRTGKLEDLKSIMKKSASGKEKWNKDPRNKGNLI